MKVNTEYLKSLRPCADRYENWLRHHKDFDGSLAEFLDLDNISHSDKLWVYLRSIPLEKVPLVAADFAELVLHLYEVKYPDDERPRKAIEAARTGINAADAADAAVDAVDAARASYAARAAARAAADAARAAVYAAYVASYAASYAAAYAARAADAARAVIDTGIEEQNNMEAIQIKIMKRYAND